MFKDIKKEDWSYNDIKPVTEAGLMGGFPDGTFRPKEYLTRAQMASILHRWLFRDGIFEDIVPVVKSYVVTICHPDGTTIGSGVIIDEGVLTCRHVAEANKEGKYRVDRWTGQNLTGKLKTQSSVPYEDLAIIEVEGIVSNGLKIATEVKQGQPVAVIGSPLDLRNSVTVGVISNTERKEGSWLQLDAPINPGNSGGPVINEKGEIVGIAVAKIVDEMVEGVGYAVSCFTIKKFLDRI